MQTGKLQSPEEICIGLRALLFGNLRPSVRMQIYEHGDRESFRRYFEKPENPGQYIVHSADSMSHWLEQKDDYNTVSWPKLFFSPVEPGEKPFHPLCRMYDYFICGESGMILIHAMKWQVEAEMSLLRYYLITLQEQLTEYLKESVRFHLPKRDELVSRLEHYQKKRLYEVILCLLFDLNLRFDSVLDDRKASGDELYLIHLEKEIPEKPEITLSPAGTEQLISDAVRTQGSIKIIEELLTDARERVKDSGGKSKRFEDMRSVEILENCWLRIWLTISKRIERCPEACNAEENEKYLNKLLAGLRETGLSKREKEKLIAFSAAERTIFHDNHFGSNSIAEQIFNTLENERNALMERTGKEDHRENLNEIQGSPGLLEEYIFVDSLREELGVSDITMNKYLRDASVNILKFSQQVKMIHKDEYRKLLEFYTEKQKNR